MILSLPLLGFSVARLGGATADVWGWTLALLSSLMYGIGTLISGSPFLALVRESAPERLQGVAITMAQTALIIFFPIVGIAFSVWMPAYEPAIFWQMIIVTMAIGGFFWIASIAGVERRSAEPGSRLRAASGERLRDVLPRIWSDRRTQLFFLFLSLGSMSAWAHEAILEPFGADVFGLSMGVTTRLNSYWQAATVVVLILGGIAWRKRRPEDHKRSATIGLPLMALGMIMLMLSGVLGLESLIIPALLVFGGGFGFYTYGGVSLMAVMSPDRHAGVYLGLWTISNLVFKGLGTFLGGALRDVFLLRLGLTPAISYGVVFALQALGLAVATLILLRIDILGFARDTGRHVDILETEIAAAD
jgi:BCD family chlorophyll transporter-like MFS transporter